MAEKNNHHSRVDDLFGTFLGLVSLGLLISSGWQVDTSGPDPFYKGPLIFPLLVLSLLLGASLPSIARLIKPPPGGSWRLDGQGLPIKSLRVLLMLLFYLVGLVYLGLEISTWLFLAVSLRVIGQRRPITLYGLPTAVTLIVYLAFKYFLDVWFPTPVLLDWIAG